MDPVKVLGAQTAGGRYRVHAMSADSITCDDVLLGGANATWVELDPRSGAASAGMYRGRRSGIVADLLQKPDGIGSPIAICIREPATMEPLLGSAQTYWTISGELSGTYCGRSREAPPGMRVEFGRCRTAALSDAEEPTGMRWFRSEHAAIDEGLHYQAGDLLACMRGASSTRATMFWFELEVSAAGRVRDARVRAAPEGVPQTCLVQALGAMRFRRVRGSARVACPVAIGRAAETDQVIVEVSGRGIRTDAGASPSLAELRRYLFGATRGNQAPLVRLRVAPDAQLGAVVEALSTVVLFDHAIDRADAGGAVHLVYRQPLPPLPPQQEPTLGLRIEPRRLALEYPLGDPVPHRKQIEHDGRAVAMVTLSDALESFVGNDLRHGSHPDVQVMVVDGVDVALVLDVIQVLGELPLGNLEVVSASSHR